MLRRRSGPFDARVAYCTTFRGDQSRLVGGQSMSCVCVCVPQSPAPRRSTAPGRAAAAGTRAAACNPARAGWGQHVSIGIATERSEATRLEMTHQARSKKPA